MSVPCQIGAPWTDGIDEYTCDCPRGYTGSSVRKISMSAFQTASPTSHSSVSTAENTVINDREFTTFSCDKDS